MKRAAALCACLFSAAALAAEEAKPADPSAPAVEPAAASASSSGLSALPPAAGPSMPTTPAALPPVSGQLFNIKGRFEVWPAVALSVGDAFYRMLAFGVRGEYHLDERVSFGAHGFFGTTWASTPVDVCGGGPCDPPAAAQLRSAPGNLDVLLGAEASWVPIYGKLSLAGEKTLHFDAYISGGPELLRQRIAADAASPITGSWTVGARVSLGQRFFLSDRWAIRLAASELLYGSPVRGRNEIERQLSLEGGVSWFFGGAR
jgi:outer membrane beta-barrel protein